MSLSYIKFQTHKGFTLVELSIVLVIIGLLIGGILTAQSMISTTEIQTQVQQLQQFDISISNFKDKYKQLPGDCNICGNGLGNNNGVINEPAGTIPANSFDSEAGAIFKDLINLGGLTKVKTWTCNGGVVVWGAIRGSVAVLSNTNGELYYLFPMSRENTGSCYIPWNVYQPWNTTLGTHTPLEALALDQKLDDGLPSSGTVAAIAGSQTAGEIPYFLDTADDSCIDTGTPNTYYTSEKTTTCHLTIKSASK